MADEAYRAVFLRVHPTGKMVLSLTTEADGKRGRGTRSRRRRARRPGARRQGRARGQNRFGEGHGYNTSPSGGTEAAIVSATGKIRDKA